MPSGVRLRMDIAYMYMRMHAQFNNGTTVAPLKTCSHGAKGSGDGWKFRPPYQQPSHNPNPKLNWPSGIGLALCKQLAAEDGCYVFMGSRSVERGQAALESLGEGVQDKIEVVALDVTDPGSIAAAKAHVEATGPLYALVNNAGCGLAHGVPAGEVIKTNLYGTVQMTEAFLPLLDSDTGRVVTVGSGAGPMWLGQQSPEDQAFFTDPAITWTAVDAYVQKHTGNLTYDDARDAYGVSKCALASWTVHLANSHPNLSCTSLSPGFIDTAIVVRFPRRAIGTKTC
jgi:NAD(P)-dependent dehydrogenase (short-subunit alcohol dehydrogenase family)